MCVSECVYLCVLLQQHDVRVYTCVYHLYMYVSCCHIVTGVCICVRANPKPKTLNPAV